MSNSTSNKKQTPPAESAGIFAQGYAVALDNFYSAIKRYGLEAAYRLCLKRAEELSLQQTLDDVSHFDPENMLRSQHRQRSDHEQAS